MKKIIIALLLALVFSSNVWASTANFYTGTGDVATMRVYGSGTYPPDGSSYATDVDGGMIDARKEPSPYSLNIGFIKWDTSSLPDTATITGATVEVFMNSIANGEPQRYVNGEFYSWTGTPSSSNYAATVGTTAFSFIYTVTSGTIEIALSNPNTYISKTGYTGIRFGISGNAPSSNYQFVPDHNSAKKPILKLAYTNGYGHKINGVTSAAKVNGVAVPTKVNGL